MERFEIWETLYEDSRSGVKVVKGWDRKLKTSVALKIRRSPEEDLLPIYKREAQTHAALDHPNICRFHCSFMHLTPEGEQQFIIAMELVATDLHKEIERRWPETHWEEPVLWKYLREAIKALSYLQERSLSHRDIKPHNMFLDEQNCVKLGDFGATRKAAGIGDFTLQGSPLYLSPLLRRSLAEEAKQHHLSRPHHNPYKSDIYSLGVSFVHMIKLEKPSDLASLKNLEERVRKCIESLQVSWKLRLVLKLMLLPNEERRPDCLQLQELLDALQPSLPEEEAVGCVFCGGVLKEPVALFCKPDEHQFCALSCFKLYVGLCQRLRESPDGSIFCPRCLGAEIPSLYILELVGGSPGLQSTATTFLRQRDLCSECRTIGTIIRITTCEHQFCMNCIAGWRKYFRQEQRHCPLCEAVFKPGAHQWLSKRCLLL